MKKLTQKRGVPNVFWLGDDHSGISLEYIKSRRVLNVGGWYDGMVGIEGDVLTLDDLAALGIPVKLEAK